MYPTSIDGKPLAGGFRMLPQTVRVFRTGFSRSDREFEETLTPCRKTSVFRQGKASRQPQAIEHSHVAVLAVLLHLEAEKLRYTEAQIQRSGRDAFAAASET